MYNIKMFTNIISVLNDLLPMFIILWLPVTIILFIIWSGMKLVKINVSMIGIILKWFVITFVIMILLWIVSNILHSALI